MINSLQTRKHTTPALNQCGFTLVELIIVMVILGIISAIAIPRFFNNQLFDDRGFYTEVINALRYAQQHAIATNCDVQVTLTATGYSLQRRAVNCNGVGGFTIAVLDPVNPGASFTGNQANVSVTADTSVFSFNALGTVSTINNNITVGGNAFCVHSTTGYISESTCP